MADGKGEGAASLYGFSRSSENKKGDKHSSEAEPVPVPLRAEADTAGRRRSDAALLAG